MRKLNKGVKIAIFAPMTVIAIAIFALIVKTILANVDIASPTATAIIALVCGAAGFTTGAIVVALCGGNTVTTPDKAHAKEVSALEAKIQELESGAETEKIAKETAENVFEKIEKAMGKAVSDADKVTAVSDLAKKKNRKAAIEKAFKKAKAS